MVNNLKATFVRVWLFYRVIILDFLDFGLIICISVAAEKVKEDDTTAVAKQFRTCKMNGSIL